MGKSDMVCQIKKDIGNGAVVSTVEKIFPIDDSNDAVPITML